MLIKLFNLIASLKTTLIGLFLMGLGVIAILLGYNYPTPLLAPGFLILLVNLLSAIIVKEKIRSSRALLIFHLSLFTLMILVMASRLTYMKGWLQVNEGESFSKMTGIIRKGYWYPDDLSGIAFRQLNYRTNINAGRRLSTQSFIQIPNQSEAFILQDQDPLKLGGYQFTLSSHIGYSILFSWQADFQVTQASVFLPPYSRYSMPSEKWPIPGSHEQLDLLLDIDTQTAMQGDFVKPKNPRLVVFYNDQKIPLTPGQKFTHEKGIFTYLGVKRWIGYDVFYDWSIPWLLATCLLAISSLGTFLWQKSHLKAWDE